MWTRFHDMHSGGSQKEDWGRIYIEAPMEEAIVIFYNRFGHNPERVTCTCCGEDYSISEHESLAQLTAFDRNCEWTGGKFIENPKNEHYTSLEKYIETGKTYCYREINTLFIFNKDIKPEERTGDVPQQGYVWAG